MAIKASKIKRKVAILLIALLSAVMLVGCTTGANDGNKEKPNKVQQIVNGGSFDGTNIYD